MNSYNFKVVGANKMNCGGCERAVKATLSDLPGVSHIKADHLTQGIELTLASGGADVDTIKEELSEIGYEVEMA
ncbi:MAG: heavy-metal-associated domain-containing protein [Ardenticatenaceae bacterium]